MLLQTMVLKMKNLKLRLDQTKDLEKGNQMITHAYKGK